MFYLIGGVLYSKMVETRLSIITLTLQELGTEHIKPLKLVLRQKLQTTT
jgi:hypothetical protein